MCLLCIYTGHLTLTSILQASFYYSHFLDGEIKGRIHSFQVPIEYCVPGAALSLRIAKMLIVPLLINMSINSDI